MVKKIKEFQSWAESGLRLLCGRITPEKRLITIVIMLVVFGFVSIYIFVSSIYNIGKNEGQQIEIEHIKQLELHSKDSTNN